DARADQFSFCVALWEALCGRRPFPTVQDAVRSPKALVEVISAGLVERPPPSARVPRRILAPVRRGLAVDRTRRGGSMDELLAALGRAARPSRTWWLVAAAVIGAAAWLIAWSAPASESTSPVACGEHEQIATVWNSSVRARYLSGAASPGAR